jgi:hypothetical protein
LACRSSLLAAFTSPGCLLAVRRSKNASTAGAASAVRASACRLFRRLESCLLLDVQLGQDRIRYSLGIRLGQHHSTSTGSSPVACGKGKVPVAV